MHHLFCGLSVAPLAVYPFARRIGLLQVPMNRISAAGNTALHGSRRALFDEPAGWDAIARRMEHRTLNEDSSFQDLYVEEIPFQARPF